MSISTTEMKKNKKLKEKQRDKVKQLKHTNLM